MPNEFTRRVRDVIHADSNLYPDPVGDISLLGPRKRLTWIRNAGGLKVTLPSRKPCDYAVVLKITKKEKR